MDENRWPRVACDYKLVGKGWEKSQEILKDIVRSVQAKRTLTLEGKKNCVVFI